MRRTEHLTLPGVLTRRQAALTVAAIAAVQRPDGSIPWFDGGHLDPWDHVEAAMALDAAGEHERAEAAYHWLADRQNADGSWYAAYTDGEPTDRGRESNFCAYPAVGVWHHYLSTGDEAFVERMWPVLYTAVEFVLGLQLPGGQIGWKRESAENGDTAVADALLTGCSSVHHALRCALAVAEHRGDPQPDWELAVGALGHAVRHHPERFLDKSRYSMDWYYPVLGGLLRGAEARERIERDWARFVVPGLGVRCVDPNPWVTGGESAELALALWAMGESDRAVRVLADIQHLRAEDGLYWTGYVFEGDRAFWPRERTTWTAGAVLLAVAALGGDVPTTAVFGTERLPFGLTAGDAGCCR